MKRFLGGIGLMLAAAAASAQGIPLAALSGVVTTEDGTPLAGVTVHLSSAALQGTRETTTSRNGQYLLELLPPGEYVVRLAAKNMQELSRTLSLPAAGTVHWNPTLRPAAITESITVSADAAPPRGSDVGATYAQHLMNQLPSGRALRDAALLAPGVNDNGPSSSLASATSPRPALMLSGAASVEGLYLVDGVVVNENVREQPQDLFIEDAIEETAVQTGRISAEFGRFMGGVVNLVTRSGGNRWSGTFRTTLSSDQWTANDAYDAARGHDTRAHNVNAVYEATLGFPILKDRLWAFGAGRLGDVGQEMETRPTERPGNVDPIPVPYTYARDERRVEGKLTAAPLPGASLVASYIDNRLDETNYAFNRSILSTDTLMDRTLPYSMLALNANDVASASLFFEGQYSRRRFGIEEDGALLSDRINGTTVADAGVTGGLRFGAPQNGGQPPSRYDNDAWSFKTSRLFSTASFGDHDVHAGYEFFRESTLEQNDVSPSGYVIGASSLVRGTEVFPVLQPGVTTITWKPILAPGARADLETHSIYVNDLVSLGRHGSLNLGVRWDKNHDRDSSGALVSDSGSLSPRLAARFDPGASGGLVFDAGYARYVAKIQETVANASSPAGNPATFIWSYGGPCINCDPSTPTGALVTTAAALDQLFRWFDANGGVAMTPFAGSLPGVSTRIAPGGLRSPSTREISAGAEAVLGTQGSVRADFLRRDTSDQYSGRIDTTTGQTPPDSFGNVYDIEEIGNSNLLKRAYTAVQIQAQYRFGARLVVAGTYTWSHLTGNFLGEFNCCAAAWGLIQEYPEYKSASWNAPVGDLTGLGIAPFSPDERHRARAWAVYEIPVSHAAISVSALESFDSSRGYEAVGSVDSTPYVVNPGYAQPLGGGHFGMGTAWYFFTKPGAFRTDDVTHTDLALDASVPAAVGVDVFVHAQVFNVFNEHAVVAVDSTVLTNFNDPSIAAFDPFTETPKAGVNYRLGPNFGKPTSSAGYQSPRTFQLGVGLRF